MAIPNWKTITETLNSKTSPIEYTLFAQELKRVDVFQKIQLIYSFIQEKQVVPDYRKHAEKSLDKSKDFRQRGNQAFINKRDMDALKFYTDSIAYAPIDSEQLALAYANRSAVFCKLEKFTSALVDINRALKNDYPKELLPKLLIRKEACISKIKLLEAEKEYIKLVTRISDMTVEDQCSEISDVNFDWKFSSPRADFKNQELPIASEKLKLTFEDNWAGRHMIAVEDIQAGELLIVEKPYAAVLFPEFFRSYCYQCFIKCQSMIPCRNCPLVMFCGEDCRKTAMNLYHDMECKILSSLLTLNQYKVELIAVRTLLRATNQGKNIDDLLNHPIYKNPFSKVDGKLNWSKDYKTDDYISIHNLEDNLEKLKMSEMLERLMMAVFLFHILKQSDFFSQGSTTKKHEESHSSTQLTSIECYTAVLMLKHLLVAEMNGNYLSSSPLSENSDRIGSGLYPMSSYFNHSCNANVEKKFFKNEIAMYSIQPALAGEQLCTDYGASYFAENKQERQSFLLNHYYFLCNCDPCKYNWPLASELPYFAWPDFLSNKPDRKKLKKLSKRFRLLAQFSSLESVKKNLDFLKEYMMYLHCNIKKPWWDYANCQELLKSAVFNVPIRYNRFNRTP